MSDLFLLRRRAQARNLALVLIVIATSIPAVIGPLIIAPVKATITAGWTTPLPTSSAVLLVTACFLAFAVLIVFLVIPPFIAYARLDELHRRFEATHDPASRSERTLSATDQMALLISIERLRREGTIDHEALAKTLGRSVEETRKIVDRMVLDIFREGVPQGQ